MLDLTAPPDCTAACSSLPTRLVLCRHSENVDWAIPPAEGASYELLVYNNGERHFAAAAHGNSSAYQMLAARPSAIYCSF